jgi:hypothetical protein
LSQGYGKSFIDSIVAKKVFPKDQEMLMDTLKTWWNEPH